MIFCLPSATQSLKPYLKWNSEKSTEIIKQRHDEVIEVAISHIKWWSIFGFVFNDSNWFFISRITRNIKNSWTNIFVMKISNWNWRNMWLKFQASNSLSSIDMQTAHEFNVKMWPKWRHRDVVCLNPVQNSSQNLVFFHFFYQLIHFSLTPIDCQKHEFFFKTVWRVGCARIKYLYSNFWRNFVWD